jgi:hypothetical protein
MYKYLQPATERTYPMKHNMNFLSLLLWVTQFGLSLLFPLCFFLVLAVFLQGKFGFGGGFVLLMGGIGLLTSVSTARSCIRSLQKDAEKVSGQNKPPVAFNDHD